MALIGERDRNGIGKNYAFAGAPAQAGGMVGGAMAPGAAGALGMPGQDIDYEIAGLAAKAKRLEGQPLSDAQRDRIREVLQSLVGLAGEAEDEDEPEEERDDEGEKPSETPSGEKESSDEKDDDKPDFLKGKGAK